MAADKAEGIRRGPGRSHTTQYLAPDSKAGARMVGSLTDALQQLTADVQTKALRSACYAGAKLLADEMTARVPTKTGKLKNAIYTWHDDKQSTAGKQVYAIGVNKREASHWFNVEYGHWRYNQHAPTVGWLKSKSKPNARGPGAHDLPGALPAPVWVPAKPYIRPTADRLPDAIRAMQQRLAERIRELRTEAAP